MARYQVTHPGFYVLSIISLAILLVLIGFFISGLLFSQQYAKEFKEDISLVLELPPEFSPDLGAQVTSALKEYPGVRTGSVEFVSRDEAMAAMLDEIGDSGIAEELENPFFDMIEFSVEEANLNQTYLDNLNAHFNQNFGEMTVYHPQDFFGDVFQLIRQMRGFVIGFIAVALFLSGILIHHIMRLNVLAQAQQIRTMQLVGARESFIIAPFLRNGLQMAFLAWLVAVALSGVVWFAMLGKDDFVQFVATKATLISALIMLIAAMLICGLSTWIAVSKSIGRSFAEHS